MVTIIINELANKIIWYSILIIPATIALFYFFIKNLMKGKKWKNLSIKKKKEVILSVFIGILIFSFFIGVIFLSPKLAEAIYGTRLVEYIIIISILAVIVISVIDELKSRLKEAA